MKFISWTILIYLGNERRQYLSVNNTVFENTYEKPFNS